METQEQYDFIDTDESNVTAPEDEDAISSQHSYFVDEAHGPAQLPLPAQIQFELSSDAHAGTTWFHEEVVHATGEGVDEECSWRDIVNFEIPDYTQANLRDIQGFQTFYSTYRGSFIDSSVAKNTRMEYATALAYALLTHFYPLSQGYIIEPCSVGPMARLGINFILKHSRPYDPSHLVDPEPRIGKAAASNEGIAWHVATKWHIIPSEDIAALVVLRDIGNADNDNDDAYPTPIHNQHPRRHPHTCLAILNDALQYNTLSKANSTHPNDVLAELLCIHTRIQTGHGILLHGTRLGFFAYDAGQECDYSEDACSCCASSSWCKNLSKDGTPDQAPRDMGPITTPIRHKGRDIALDLSTVELEAITTVFQRDIWGKKRVTYVSEDVTPDMDDI